MQCRRVYECECESLRTYGMRACVCVCVWEYVSVCVFQCKSVCNCEGL